MKKMFLKCFLISFLCLGCSAQNDNLNDETSTEETPINTEEFRLLFIGNSLTYTNDLPNLVKDYGKTKGKSISVKSVAYGNYALIDHWEDGEIQALIETQSYNYVIVQQGPSSQAFGKALLLEYGEKISNLCRENYTNLAFYMVWPSITYYDTFQGVIDNYRLVATLNNDLLCPVGEVWKSHFDTTNDFSYYGSDGFHPSLEGSQVAAQVIYEALFN